MAEGGRIETGLTLQLPRDYQDLLEAFLAAEVEFVLIGGWAAAVHGHGRATDDMDVLVRAEDAAECEYAVVRCCAGHCTITGD